MRDIGNRRFFRWCGDLLQSGIESFEQNCAPVAQWIRALASGAKGRGFKSLQARHFFWGVSLADDFFSIAFDNADIAVHRQR